ncbi:hypothetical protein F9K72_21655 [Brucella intermedia]|nr:hypothetical protein F9K72_21655 [Brucella intermedia]
MKTSRFSEPQILSILPQAEGGVSVTAYTGTYINACRKHAYTIAVMAPRFSPAFCHDFNP